MFEPLPRLLLGLLTGFLFGFLLQKGRVSKAAVIRRQFTFQDFTMMRVMLTAVLVGGAGVYALRALGLATLHPKPAQLAAVPLGGLILGVGLVVLGYCPGTCLAAAGEGKRNAWFGVLGMMLGVVVFAAVFPALKAGLLSWRNLGPVTLPELTGIPAAAWFALLAAGCLFLFRWLDRRPASS
jgi:hypothetical protein